MVKSRQGGTETMKIRLKWKKEKRYLLTKILKLNLNREKEAILDKMVAKKHQIKDPVRKRSISEKTGL